jgi:hypothetical protein
LVVAGVVFAWLAWSASHPFTIVSPDDENAAQNDPRLVMIAALVLTLACLPAAFVVAVAVVRRRLWTISKAVWIALPLVVALDVVVMANYWFSLQQALAGTGG